ncbi:MAG: type II toxin-antitoxin system HicA family toxin [Patescibacteria group bacterium]
MSIVPILTAVKLLRILKKAGFLVLRIKGSHYFLEHPITKKFTSIPMHSGNMKRGLMMGILKQAGISVKEFIRLLGK